jgi:hypothetical protein
MGAGGCWWFQLSKLGQVSTAAESCVSRFMFCFPPLCLACSFSLVFFFSWLDNTVII